MHTLKDNMNNKINFMSRILAEHGNLNRVEFGDALWNSVLRPSISHCCGAWLTSSKVNEDLLSSIQFRSVSWIHLSPNFHTFSLSIRLDIS
jgi:hypothetical protein